MLDLILLNHSLVCWFRSVHSIILIGVLHALYDSGGSAFCQPIRVHSFPHPLQFDSDSCFGTPWCVEGWMEDDGQKGPRRARAVTIHDEGALAKISCDIVACSQSDVSPAPIHGGRPSPSLIKWNINAPQKIFKMWSHNPLINYTSNNAIVSDGSFRWSNRSSGLPPPGSWASLKPCKKAESIFRYLVHKHNNIPKSIESGKSVHTEDGGTSGEGNRITVP